MSTNESIKRDDPDGLAKRLEARRAKQDQSTGESGKKKGEGEVKLGKTTDSEPSPIPNKPVEDLGAADPQNGMSRNEPIKRDDPGGLANRLIARREKQGESTDRSGKKEGGGEVDLGKEFRRAPLFISLGLKANDSGRTESEAPPVPNKLVENLGAPDPQPARTRRPKL